MNTQNIIINRRHIIPAYYIVDNKEKKMKIALFTKLIDKNAILVNWYLLQIV